MGQLSKLNYEASHMDKTDQDQFGQNKTMNIGSGHRSAKVK